MKRADMIAKLSPAAPPCFPDRLAWLEYLRVADVDARDTLGGPVQCQGSSCTFNSSFDFCADCTDDYRSSMQRAGQCRPQWLKEPA